MNDGIKFLQNTEIKRGDYKAVITDNGGYLKSGTTYFVSITTEDDDYPNGRVCHYPASRSYASLNAAIRGAEHMLGKVA
tara:strand:- start:448 stop:684 length:237 start_codon:yes stop_codon:yes gene_type:complete